MLTTTLNNLAGAENCAEARFAVEDLLRFLGKTDLDDDPVPLADIAEVLGVRSAVWALRSTKGHQGPARLFAIWCARKIQHMVTDATILESISCAEKLVTGSVTEQDLSEIALNAYDIAIHSYSEGLVGEAAFAILACSGNAEEIGHETLYCFDLVRGIMIDLATAAASAEVNKTISAAPCSQKEAKDLHHKAMIKAYKTMYDGFMKEAHAKFLELVS